MNQAVSVKPAIGIGAVVIDPDERVLLVRRANPPQAGLWHIPGGRLEAGETLEDCCRREVMEETGLAVVPSRIVAIADRQIEGFHYVIIDFLAELADGGDVQPRPSSDAEDARWVPLSGLADFPLVEGLAEVIRRSRVEGAPGLAVSQGISWLFTA